MNQAYEDVKLFHTAFGHPTAAAPQLLPPQRVEDRARWMDEELDEFRRAETLVDQADAMIDLIYFALGTLVEMGVQPGPLFAIVQRANMAKLDPDGQPLRRADGKIVKPPGWQDPAPLLAAEIARQGAALRGPLGALARALSIPETTPPEDVLRETLIRVHEDARRRP